MTTQQKKRDGVFREIPLGGKYGKGYILIVDECDFDVVNSYSWHRTPQGYAYAHIPGSGRSETTGRKISAHSLIYCRYFTKPKNKEIDHINHNPLDCRLKNLREATHQENCWNQAKTHGLSKFKGVGWAKYNKSWRAYISYNNKITWLGYFKKEVDAAKTYNIKAQELFGEFAQLNIIN